MILDACRRLREAAVLATVVQVRGSAYRRPGARMLIEADGTTHGLVSGGCLEADLADKAQAVFAEQRSRTVVYDMRSPDDIVWGLGLGCEGEIRVLLERIEIEPLPQWMQLALDARQRREPIAVATVFESDDPDEVGRRYTDPSIEGPIGDGLRRAHQERRSFNAPWGFVEWIQPPVRLFLFGAGADAEPVVRLAEQLGWIVDCFDHREQSAIPAALVDYRTLDVSDWPVDERTAVLLMTHHFLHDQTLLGQWIERPVGYLGLLGPKRRRERLLEQLERPANDAPLYGPVGLDIGAETPQEIALAIVAEIQAAFQGRDGGFLRDRQGALHDWPR